MRFILAILFIAQALITKAQAVTTDKRQTDVKLQSASVPVVSSKEKIIVQSNDWKQQAEQKPADANAWLNYYNWLDRNRELDEVVKKDQLNDAITTSGKYITGTWQLSLMKFLQSGKRDSASLFSAMRLSPSKAAIYPYAVQYSIINNDPQMLWLFCKAMNEESAIPPGLYEYHYNVLMSAEQNAIIYARGINDLVPMAILQQIFKVREDLLLKYYEGIPDDQDNAYLCLSLGKEVLSLYPNGIYTGLLVKIGNEKEDASGVDPLAKFSLSYLEASSHLTSDEQLIYRNYLPSFILTYNNYKVKNDPKATEWKSRIQKLAQMTGTSETVNGILQNK